MPAPDATSPVRWQAILALGRERGRGVALLYALYRLADRLVALRVYRVRVLELEHMTEREEAAGFDCRFLEPDEVARFAEDPANDLTPRFVRLAASGQHLCFAALSDGALVSYTWYALGEVDPADSSGVPLHLPADAVYTYKGFTRPELRGRHLHGRLKRPVVEALLARGFSRRVALVEWTNWASLRTGERSGYRDVGWLVTLGAGPRPLGFASPGPARHGIRLGRRAPAARGTLPPAGG
jgi:hypothetical protein